MSCAALRRDGVVTPVHWILREIDHPMVSLVRQQIVGLWVKKTRKQLSSQDIECVEYVLGWVSTFGTATPDDGLVKTCLRLMAQGQMPLIRDAFGDRSWLRVRLSVEKCIARVLEVPAREVHNGEAYSHLVEVCEYLTMLISRPEDWIDGDGKHVLLPDFP